MSRLLSALAVASILLLSGEASSQAPANTGRVLSYRLESFNINLDPARIVDTQSRRIVDMLHAKLVVANPSGDYKGEIANRWTWTNSNTLQLQLRDGLTFSNGKLITAQDVVWSLCRLLQPAAPYRWLFANVKHDDGDGKQEVNCTGLRATDKLSLEIEVTSDPSRLLPALASSSAAIIPMASKPADFGALPGAGPYEVEQIVSNSRIILRQRAGGPLQPKARQVIFQLVQDDAAAATLFKSGKLDVVEISNPTLYRLLVRSDGKLSVPGRLIGMDTHQIRLVIFNRASIGRALRLSDDQVKQWILGIPSLLNLPELHRRIAPLAIQLDTSYFPARSIHARPSYNGSMPAARGKLLVITENDPYSDAIAAAIPQKIGGTEVDHVGLEKSVLVSRLLKKEFDIASITLEAMMNHNSYWLSFFTPGSPFTIFGEPLQGLDLSGRSDTSTAISNARQIDSHGNWLALFQERHYYAFQPRIDGESFLQTGLINYATIGEER